MLKNILITILLIAGFSTVAFAAPYFRQEASIVPIDSTENIGTSTAPWDEGHFNEICLSADCKTAWPSGSGGGTFPFTPGTYGSQAINSTSTGLWLKDSLSLIASSTFSTYASSTQLTNSGNTYLTGLTSALVSAGSDGLLAEYTGIDCTNQFIRDVSAAGAGTCETVGSADVSGLDISADTNLAVTFPVVLSNDTLSFSGLSTSSPIAAASGLLYATGVNTLASVSTSSAISMSITGNSGTATALAGNGSNCSSGFFPLGVDASGVSETCTYAFATTTPWSTGVLAVSNAGLGYTIASSTLFGYTPLNPTRQLTIAGTANQITSSAGAQDLSADRTWTLSFPNHIIFPGNFQATNATTTNATTTSLAITNLTAADCDVKALTTGVIYCGTDSTSAGSDFDFEDNYGALNAATSSILWAKSGINASSTSHFVNLNVNAINSIATLGNLRLTGNDTVSLNSGDGNGYLEVGNSAIQFGNFVNGTYDFFDSTSAIGTLDFESISTDRTFSFPNVTGTIGVGSATTSGTLPYWLANSGLGSVATTSVTCSGGTSCSGLVALGTSPTISSFTYPFPSNATSTALTFSATTTHTTAQFGSTAIGNNVVKISPLTGLSASASESAGGLVNITTLTTDSIGLAMYNNHTGTSRLLSLVCDSASYGGNCLHVRSDGTATALNVSGAPSGQGLIKAGANGVGDADAAIGSFDASTSGFLGQVFFFKCGTNPTCWNMRDAGNNQNLTASYRGYFGWGTTTPAWQVQIASTTGAQLALTDPNAAANLKHWTFRSKNGTLYIASSTDAYATSTLPALRIDTDGKLVGWDAANDWTGTISPTRSFVLGSGTTTTWTASTTGSAYSPEIVMPFAGTLRQVRCATDASFLGVNVTVNASNATPSYFVASTTVGKVSYTAGNTFTAGQKILANFGTTTTATTKKINCTFDVTET